MWHVRVGFAFFCGGSSRPSEECLHNNLASTNPNIYSRRRRRKLIKITQPFLIMVLICSSSGRLTAERRKDSEWWGRPGEKVAATLMITAAICVMTTMSRLLETFSKSLGFLSAAFRLILTNSWVETQTSYVSALGASFRGHSDENFFSCERTQGMSEMRNYKSVSRAFDKQGASSLSSQLKLMEAIKLHRKRFACRITKHSLRDFGPSLRAARSAEECLSPLK